jgi:hypothetical protein
MSFYLLFVLALPVLFNTETVMSLWLKEVPEHSVLFVQLFLVFTLSECISQPLITAMFATGNIRNYQIVVGGLQLLNLPVSYVLLKMGAMPEVTVIVAVVISQICLAARLFMLEKMIGLSVRNFLVRVYFNVLAVAAVALVLPVVAALVVPGGPVGFVVNASVAVISAGLSIFLVGCSKQERRDVIGFIKNRLGGKKS